MALKKSRAYNGSGILVYIGIGVLLAMISTFLLTIILTSLIENGTVQLTSAPMLILGIHFISVFLGCILGMTMEKGRYLLISGSVAGIYFVFLLLINLLVFSSGIEGIFSVILSTASGGITSWLIKGLGTGRKKNRIKVRSS